MLTRLRIPPLGPFGRLALLALALVVAIGVALGWLVRSAIEDRLLASAGREAVAVSNLALDGRLDRQDLRDGLDRAERRELKRVVGRGAMARELARVTLWSRSRSPLISIGGPPGRISRAALDAALAGGIRAELTGRGSGERLGVLGPLRLAGRGQPTGAVDLEVPAQQVKGALAEITLVLYLSLGVGLTLLYGAVLRLGFGASRALERRAADSRHRAQHDALTGLPNRGLFRDLVKQAVERRPRRGAVMAVMVMDLDRFKEINDTLGHYNGDLLLQRVGPRIEGALRDPDTVARLGGDEYAVLLPNMPDLEAVRHAAERILKELREPFVIGGLSLEVEASIGIALCPDHGDRVDALLQRADVAMYRAKEQHSGFELYSADQHEYSPARLALVGELRRGIDDNELRLFYQPKAELATGRVTGVEGLARWEHPRRGLLGPDQFIALAEHTSLITPLTLHVLETAIRQCRAWEKEGFALTVAVNLSMRNLLDGHMPGKVAGLLDRYSVDPARLELEITESMIMSDPRRALAVLTQIDAMGVRLSIDDFGTGYSSLAYLRDLPVRTIKIDKSFVLDMLEDEGDAKIVQSTVDLGQNLGLSVVAEGVETAEAWRRLATMGCDTAQGYFLSRPLPPGELEEWLLGRPRPSDLAPQVDEVTKLRAVGGLER